MEHLHYTLFGKFLSQVADSGEEQLLPDRFLFDFRDVIVAGGIWEKLKRMTFTVVYTVTQELLTDELGIGFLCWHRAIAEIEKEGTEGGWRQTAGDLKCKVSYGSEEKTFKLRFRVVES